MGGVKKFHEILQQICENLEGWSKNAIFFLIFPFLDKTFFLGVGGQGLGFFMVGGTRLRIFQVGVKAYHPHPLGIMYGVNELESLPFS